MEMHKRKAIESAQSAADLKLHLEKYHSQIKVGFFLFYYLHFISLKSLGSESNQKDRIYPGSKYWSGNSHLHFFPPLSLTFFTYLVSILSCN